MDDLLQAERDLRRKSEDTIRAMRQVLVETANRLGGTRLESLRRDDPSIPANWGAADWKKFFDEISVEDRTEIKKIMHDLDDVLHKLKKEGEVL